MEIDFPSPLGVRTKEKSLPASHPCLREEKSGEKNRGGDITPMRLRRSLFFVAPATPAGTPSGRQPGETVKALPGRPGRGGCGLPGAPKRPWPAYLTTWRGEVRERVVRTRREPLGARRCTCKYIEHGKQAQRSHGGLIACFDRQGGEICRSDCRARGAFVLSNQAAQDARVLRADELRPRRIDGASWSQIRCRNGR